MKNLISRVFTRRLFTKNRRVISMFLLCFLLVGCGDVSSEATKDEKVAADEDTISVVTTIFPEYDWVKQVVGENSPPTTRGIINILQ